MNAHLLSILIWLPIVGGFVVLGVGNERASAARWMSLAVSLAALALSIPLFIGFSARTAQMQFVEHTAWIPPSMQTSTSVSTGFRCRCILPDTFTTVLIVIAGQSVTKRVSQYFAAFLILEGLMIGVFAALDAALFLRVLGGDAAADVHHHRRLGGPRRVYATIKFFLYTFIGSLLMLVAADLHVSKSGSYEIALLQGMR